MLTRIEGDKRITLTEQEEIDIRAEWAANEAAKQLSDIARAKEAQKEQLRREKIDSMLTVEFAEVDAAAIVSDIKQVKVK